MAGQIIKFGKRERRCYEDAAREQGIFDHSHFIARLNGLCASVIRDLYRNATDGSAVQEVLDLMSNDNLMAVNVFTAEYERPGSGLERLAHELSLRGWQQLDKRISLSRAGPLLVGAAPGEGIHHPPGLGTVHSETNPTGGERPEISPVSGFASGTRIHVQHT